MDTKPPKPIRIRPYIPVHNPELAIYIDKGCPVGGPSCLRCKLERCVEDDNDA